MNVERSSLNNFLGRKLATRRCWPSNESYGHRNVQILSRIIQFHSASKNLGNKIHRDNDAARSFAVWVNKKGDASKSWYLLFPEWEVAIVIANGTWISWDGKCCGHCTAVPSVAEDDELLSLFCSLPARLCNHLKK